MASGASADRAYGGGGESFRPYVSLLSSFRSQTQPEEDTPHDSYNDPSEPPIPPPWRQAIGRAFFSLHPDIDTLPVGPSGCDDFQDIYIQILRDTYRNFSQTVIGSDVPSEGQSQDQSPGQVPGDWKLDALPSRGIIEGDSEVIYQDDSAQDEQAQSAPVKPFQAGVVFSCWNCGSTEHQLGACTQARDRHSISLNREAYRAWKHRQDMSMPQSARQFLEGYTFTPSERERRLSLLSRFVPGKPSEGLCEAVLWPSEDDDEEGQEPSREVSDGLPHEITLGRKKMQTGNATLPWYLRMMEYGYPPGWYTIGGELISHHNPMSFFADARPY